MGTTTEQVSSTSKREVAEAAIALVQQALDSKKDVVQLAQELHAMRPATVPVLQMVLERHGWTGSSFSRAPDLYVLLQNLLDHGSMMGLQGAGSTASAIVPSDVPPADSASDVLVDGVVEPPPRRAVRGKAKGSPPSMRSLVGEGSPSEVSSPVLAGVLGETVLALSPTPAARPRLVMSPLANGTPPPKVPPLSEAGSRSPAASQPRAVPTAPPVTPQSRRPPSDMSRQCRKSLSRAADRVASEVLRGLTDENGAEMRRPEEMLIPATPRCAISCMSSPFMNDSPQNSPRVDDVDDELSKSSSNMKEQVLAEARRRKSRGQGRTSDAGSERIACPVTPAPSHAPPPMTPRRGPRRSSLVAPDLTPVEESGETPFRLSQLNGSSNPPSEQKSTPMHVRDT